jgi:hypothetical protein
MKKITLTLLLGALYSTHAIAGPADYVYTPNVESGEKEIDFKFGSAEQPDRSHATGSSLGFGYGATENWFTEIYMKREREENTGTSLAEWENKFQLTETGKYPVDIGLITEIEAPVSNHGQPYELTFGPLFQTDFGKLQLNGNVLFQRKLGPRDATTTTYNTDIGYQWQVKYRWQRAFEFGAQGFGGMGAWNDSSQFEQQTHRFGPAVFGKLDVGQKQAIRYNAAMLYGATNGAPDHTFRMQVEYEF